jgi:hypothetical protein
MARRRGKGMSRGDIEYNDLETFKSFITTDTSTQLKHAVGRGGEQWSVQLFKGPAKGVWYIPLKWGSELKQTLFSSEGVKDGSTSNSFEGSSTTYKLLSGSTTASPASSPVAAAPHNDDDESSEDDEEGEKKSGGRKKKHRKKRKTKRRTRKPKKKRRKTKTKRKRKTRRKKRRKTKRRY